MDSVFSNIKTILGRVRITLGRYWPAHLNDPFGLLVRLIRNGNRAAYFTLWAFALTVIAIPLDWLMTFFERRQLQDAPNRKYPIVFICGPARSGTTITHQLVVAALPVAYFSNLTGIFPRSPLTAQKLFRRWLRKKQIDTQSYYGKTSHMTGANDADHIWNRWVQADERFYRTRLEATGANTMARFFRCMEKSESRPIVCKNNKLLAFADDVDEAIENAWFICLSRDPRYLAQSLIVASEQMQGDASVGYGLRDSASGDESNDPIVLALKQVLYNERLISAQQKKIGPDRFWIESYEKFCEDPSQLIGRIATEILKIDSDADQWRKELPSLVANNHAKLAEHDLERLDALMAEIEFPSAKGFDS